MQDYYSWVSAAAGLSGHRLDCAGARDLDWEAGFRRTRTELAPALWKSEEISPEERDGLADWSLAGRDPPAAVNN
jgi:hypothetical protein